MKNEAAKQHGNKGNTNAKKDAPLDTSLVFRLSRADKALMVKQAQREGLKLSEWCMKHLMPICTIEDECK